MSLTENEPLTQSDLVFRNELRKTMRESVHHKKRGGHVLGPEQITALLIAWIGAHDVYAAFWDEGDAERCLVIRWPSDDDEKPSWRGNSAWVRDRATAIALHAACRAEDNVAPPPPEQ